MYDKKTNVTSRLVIGLILIFLGGLFLLDNYGIIDFSLPDFLFQWEYILISIGIIVLSTSHNKTAGTILIAIGLLNLFPDFWPILLVGLGIYIITRRSKSGKDDILNAVNDIKNPQDKSEEDTKTHNRQNRDSIDDIAIFGGGTKTFSFSNFKGGKLTAIFGGSEIHLGQSRLAHGQNELDLFVMFGGYTIIVPQDWNIIIDIVPVFGGFSDKRIKDPNRVYEDDKILIIKGFVLFGGGEVKF